MRSGLPAGCARRVRSAGLAFAITAAPERPGTGAVVANAVSGFATMGSQDPRPCTSTGWWSPLSGHALGRQQVMGCRSRAGQPAGAATRCGMELVDDAGQDGRAVFDAGRPP
jgi:hypothetical protein